MQKNQQIRDFIADWFQRFDRLDPIDAFLPDLAENVVWDMDDVDPTLDGHDRVRAWYEGVLKTFKAPTTHDVTDIELGDETVKFKVRFGAHLKEGGCIDALVSEQWRFTIRPNGRPLITHYTANPIKEEDNENSRSHSSS